MNNLPASLYLFNRYSYLAYEYSKKINNVEKISLTKEDISQELLIKLHMSILAYGRRWSEYKATGRRKPVPLIYWLKSTLNNRLKDFYKRIQEENYLDTIGGDEDNIDVGYKSDFEELNTFDYKTHNYVINGVNILDGLGSKERIMFSLFIQGKDKKELNKIFSKHFNSNEVIKNQIEKLTKKSELKERYFSNNSFICQKIY
jgi:hypothetical protein